MGRAPCCDKANVKRGPWSPEEDAKLKEYMDKNGTGGNWIALPQKAGLRRCGKSCRLRWLNYLRPNIRHGEFSDDEDRIICSLFASIGSRWSIIASQLPGRTDNDIKNYWNTKLRKKLMAPYAHQHLKIPLPLSTINVQNSLMQNSSMPSQYSSLNSNMSSSAYEFGNYDYTATPVMSFTRGYNIPMSQSLNNKLQDGGDFNQQVINDSNINSNLLVFGREKSCSTSSDGSCITNANIVSHGKELVEHTTCGNLDMQSYFSNDHEYQNYLISTTTNAVDEKAAGVANGCFSENPLDFGIEEIKQLIGTNNNLNFYLDEIKTEDKYLYDL